MAEKKRVALELGQGTSLRSGDYTRAAVRAVKDALWHNSLTMAQAFGAPKITKDGVYLEELEHNPAKYLPEVEAKLGGEVAAAGVSSKRASDDDDAADDGRRMTCASRVDNTKSRTPTISSFSWTRR